MLAVINERERRGGKAEMELERLSHGVEKWLKYPKSPNFSGLRKFQIPSGVEGEQLGAKVMSSAMCPKCAGSREAVTPLNMLLPSFCLHTLDTLHLTSLLHRVVLLPRHLKI